MENHASERPREQLSSERSSLASELEALKAGSPRSESFEVKDCTETAAKKSAEDQAAAYLVSLEAAAAKKTLDAQAAGRTAALAAAAAKKAGDDRSTLEASNSSMAAAAGASTPQLNSVPTNLALSEGWTEHRSRKTPYKVYSWFKGKNLTQHEHPGQPRSPPEGGEDVIPEQSGTLKADNSDGNISSGQLGEAPVVHKLDMDQQAAETGAAAQSQPNTPEEADCSDSCGSAEGASHGHDPEIVLSLGDLVVRLKQYLFTELS